MLINSNSEANLNVKLNLNLISHLRKNNHGWEKTQRISVGSFV